MEEPRALGLFLERLGELERGRFSFALETTLAGLSYQRRIKQWKDRGYKVTLLFLWLPSEEMAVLRVRERVAQGGHNIPEADIRRRYHRGIRDFVSVYLSLVDDAWVLNASMTPPKAIWKRQDDTEEVFNVTIWQMIEHYGEKKQ